MRYFELLFATSNRAKLAQIQFVSRSLNAPVQVVSAYERYLDYAIYTEQGSTAAEIARQGALTIAMRLGTPVIAEDTTLHVDALEGEPGIHAGKYLKEQGRAGLLKALEGRDNRTATIVSAAAWASPYGDTQTWVNSVCGEIALQESWEPGLPNWVAPTPADTLGGGYNAIFIPEGCSRTLAEIPAEDALQIGYREPNFSAMILFLMERKRLRLSA